MSRRTRVILAVAGSLVGLILALLIAALVVVRTNRFQNYVREEIISSVEDSTGGKVDVQAFRFDADRMTATVTGFVIHGTEPSGSAPLFEAPSIVLTLRLLSSLKKPLVLEYLGVDHPSANVIVLPNGQTNIPEPKKKSTSNKSGLETVVNLAIRRIEINQGSIHFLEESVPVNVQGRDLLVVLAYNVASTHYQGKLSVQPLVADSPGRPPLEAKIDVPLDLGADAIQITNARITTPQSAINANASIQHMAAPRISVQVVAHIGLEELARSIDLPIHPTAGLNTLEATVAIATTEHSMRIENAVAKLGRTEITASGDLRQGAEVRADLVLEELGKLMQLSERPAGIVQIAGTAKIPESGPFVLAGKLSSRNLAYNEFRDVRLASAFRVDSRTAAVSDLTLTVLGGEVRADAKLEDFSRITAAGSLRGFNIQRVTAALLKKPVNYGGTIGGTIHASGELKKTINARAQLRIAPAGPGVPMSGNLDATYDGAKGLISLSQSHIALPNSRIDLSGQIGKTADIRVESRNLDDFSPLMNVSSTVKLKGGTGTLAIHETGPLGAPQVSGQLRVTKFALEDRTFDQLSADLKASPSNASVENGVLKRNGSLAQFSGSVGLNQWRIAERAPLTAKLTANGSDVADILALAGRNAPVTGTLNADITIGGTVQNPQGLAQISAGPGSAYGELFDRFQLLAHLSDQRVDLNSLELNAGGARFQAHGSFTHPRDSFTTGRIELHAATNQIELAQFKTLQEKRAGLSGIVAFNSDVFGDLRKNQDQTEFAPSAMNAKLTGSGLGDKGQRYGDIAASATTYGSELNTRVDSNVFGSQIQVTARTQLRTGYSTVADASIRSLPIDKALAVATTGPPQATGNLSAQAHFTGTLDDPHADLSFDLAGGTILDETLTRLDGKASYTNQLATLSALDISSPAGAIQAHGSCSHNAGDLSTGKMELHISAPGVQLHRVRNLEKIRPGLEGIAHLTADISADVRRQGGQAEVLPLSAEIKGGLDNLQLNKKPLGGLTFEGHTASSVLAMKLDAELVNSQIHGTGQVQLHGDYAGNAKLTVGNVRYSAFAGLLGWDAPFDGLMEGQADFSGPFRRPENGTGDVQLSRLELSSKDAPIALHNDGPIAIRLNRSEIDIQKARLTGPSTNIDLTGKVALNRANPLDLALNANIDLAVIKQLQHDAYSGGSVSANVTARGTFTKPQINGRVDLKNASLQLLDWPNGISNGNGSILLNGNNARISSLTAEVGGGKVTVDGSAGYTGAAFDYDLRAKAQQVRTRYSGASVTSNAALTFSGTSQRGMLGGTVTITRVGYNQQSDIGAILTGATTPPSTPPTSGIAARTRLNIKIQTAPGVRFQTSLAEGLSATADLTVLGNLQTPGMVGRVNVNSGTLIFFGNKYEVNRGSVSFFTPTAIEPILDIDLQTSVQGVSVDLTISGPIENMKLSYRSDPPLKFDDIVGLLATGRTPPDPTIAVNQPYTPDQTATQMGESAIVGQAIANPVADRLQRVFGVTQVKISPEFVAGSTLPQARITLQQQVSNSITFTYSQDLSQANAQLIRVELALTPRFSAVATRDENGILGVDFFYKKQFR